MIFYIKIQITKSFYLRFLTALLLNLLAYLYLLANRRKGVFKFKIWFKDMATLLLFFNFFLFYLVFICN